MNTRPRPATRFVYPSTRAFFRKAMARKELPFFTRVLEALHGWLYLRAPVFYIGMALGRHPKARYLREALDRIARLLGLWNEAAGKSFAESYHGKVVPSADMTRLIRLGRSLELQVPENVLPFRAAREIILENPEALAVLECPCRASMPNPCLPLDVCLIIGRTFVDFVHEHHPHKSRRIGVDEAVDIVDQARKRGHVTHAFFKEAVLGRWYAVCNCCSCCCGAMQAQREGVPMLVSSGYRAVVSAQDCLACGLCAKKCPFGAISFEGPPSDRGSPRIDAAVCLGCDVCTLQCPSGALRLERAADKPAPLWDVVEKSGPAGG